MNLTLIVENTADLEGGAKATAVFDEQGGMIGALPELEWVLADRRGSVAERHARIFYADGQFCMEAIGNADLFVNGATLPLNSGEPFQVRDGDTIGLGKFRISAYVTVTIAEDEAVSHGERWARRFISVGALVGDMSDEEVTGRNLFDSKLMRRDRNILLHERLNKAQRADPIELLEEQTKGRSIMTKDPVKALDHDKKDKSSGKAALDDYLDLELETASSVAVPDDQQPQSVYFSPPKVKPAKTRKSEKETAKPQPGGGEPDMDAYLAALATGRSQSASVSDQALHDVAVRDRWVGHVETTLSNDQLVDHVVLRPLCAALGLPIQDMTVPQANHLAREIGEALKAAVAGIMETHKREFTSRSNLAETHLHAIEDNPLRLDQTPDDAIRDLFLAQSPVHLSASAAIGESLTMLRLHQEASEAASEAALDAVLRALAPLSLARRFMKYKGHAPRSGDLDAWHWNMYQHYYTELRSDHQGGLSRMFWEVYAQVYDREMRQRTSQVE